ALPPPRLRYLVTRKASGMALRSTTRFQRDTCPNCASVGPPGSTVVSLAQVKPSGCTAKLMRLCRIVWPPSLVGQAAGLLTCAPCRPSRKFPGQACRRKVLAYSFARQAVGVVAGAP